MRVGRAGLLLAALAVILAVTLVVPSALAGPSVAVHLRGYGPAQVIAGTTQAGAIDLDAAPGQQLVFSVWSVYEGGTQPTWLDGQTTRYTVPAGVDTVSIYASYAPVDACDYIP